MELCVRRRIDAMRGNNFGVRPSLAAKLLSVLPSSNYAYLGLGSGFVNSSGVCGSAPDVRGGSFPNLTSTGTARPAYSLDASGDPVLTFDGVGNYLKALFTLNVGCTIWLVVKQVVWDASANTIADGAGVLSSATVYMGATTPKIRQFAGTDGTENANLAVGAWGIVEAQFNGASSSLRVNETAAVVSNPGSRNPGGLTIGATAGPAHFSNIAVKHIVVASIIPTAAQLAAIRSIVGKAAHVGGY